MTEELFREDGYLRSCQASVIAVLENGFVTDRTVFYPMGGGQPGDTGRYSVVGDSDSAASGLIIDCVKDRETGQHLHVVEQDGTIPSVGDRVDMEIDWERRYRLMRMHSCMHMLCAAVPEAVTGGSIRDGSGRLDFDIPEPPDKQAIEDKLNAFIDRDVPMNLSWITDEEMDAQHDMVRTMSVQPPRGSGKVRLVNFEGVDLQPCGGTHVARSGEIGKVRVLSIKKKGKQNRRITVEFA